MLDDVFVYSTPMLDRSVEVTGPIELHLFVSSSARDTGFTGELVDGYPFLDAAHALGVGKFLRVPGRNLAGRQAGLIGQI